MKHSAGALLVNPWIYDFAAYNYWIRPMGLLYLASTLRRAGVRVTLIDCLEWGGKRKNFGDGKFLKTPVGKPEPLKSVQRRYSRYGMPEDIFKAILDDLYPPPDVICITSAMTYWYPGVFRAIDILRTTFPGVPIVLGGIYATLLPRHAREFSGADFIYLNGAEYGIEGLLEKLLGIRFSKSEEMQKGRESPYFSLSSCVRESNLYGRYEEFIYPSFDLYSHLDFICIITSRGCPFRCPYCASSVLSNGYTKRSPEDVIREIEYWAVRKSVKNIVFYDDALLFDAKNHFIPIMEGASKLGIRCHFHTPNGLSVRHIDDEVAQILYENSFKTIRLGFETSNPWLQAETGGKVTNEEFKRAVLCLKGAGYSSRDIMVNILAGLPGQRAEEVKESLAYALELGTRPKIVEYSPVPGTPMFQQAKKLSRYDIESEPLFHNNSIFPCEWDGFTIEDLRRLKQDLKMAIGNLPQ